MGDRDKPVSRTGAVASAHGARGAREDEDGIIRARQESAPAAAPARLDVQALLEDEFFKDSIGYTIHLLREEWRAEIKRLETEIANQRAEVASMRERSGGVTVLRPERRDASAA